MIVKNDIMFAVNFKPIIRYCKIYSSINKLIISYVVIELILVFFIIPFLTFQKAMLLISTILALNLYNILKINSSDRV